MRQYLGAVVRRLGGAAFDVLFVALIGLAPLLLGRLILVIKPQEGTEKYWTFLTNGQLAFYSMGSLATLLLFCFRKKLPDVASLWIGLFSTACLLFLMVLVGVDPTLHAESFSFVGIAAFYLYLAVLLVRILADAIKDVSPSDALNAGRNASLKTENELKRRKAGGQA